MSVLAVFRWCENTSVGAALRSSQWLFPVIEAWHLIALAVMGAAVLIVDLRLWGFGLRRRSIPEVAAAAQPLLLGSLVMMFVSGYMLFASSALRYYYSVAFWLKMVALFFALLYTFTLRRKIVMANQERVGPYWGRLAALVSIALWTGVGVSAKAIALLE